jgi:hypothetical protein
MQPTKPTERPSGEQERCGDVFGLRKHVGFNVRVPQRVLIRRAVCGAPELSELRPALFSGHNPL